MDIFDNFRKLADSVRAESSFSLHLTLVLRTHIIIDSSGLRHLHYVFLFSKYFVSLVGDFTQPN